jgi:hypothetical protein
VGVPLSRRFCVRPYLKLGPEFQVIEVEDIGFKVGKSSAEPSLKLHLLRLEMQPLCQDEKICDLAL